MSLEIRSAPVLDEESAIQFLIRMYKSEKRKNKRKKI